MPSIGQLPTHFEVVDVSKFLVTIPEEPKDLSNQEIINKVEFSCAYFSTLPKIRKMLFWHPCTEVSYLEIRLG